jgi:hypothetical protein
MPTDKPEPGRCGRQCKQSPGQFCNNPAGLRTAHPGSGACFLHGGQSKRGDKRVIGGLWSKALTPKQGERLAEIKSSVGGAEETAIDGAIVLMIKLSEIVADEGMDDERKVELLGHHLPRASAVLAAARKASEQPNALAFQWQDMTMNPQDFMTSRPMPNALRFV